MYQEKKKFGKICGCGGDKICRQCVINWEHWGEFSWKINFPINQSLSENEMGKVIF